MAPISDSKTFAWYESPGAWATVLVAGVFGSTLWLVGDLTDPSSVSGGDGGPIDWDYMVTPLGVSAQHEFLLGVLSIGMTIISAFVLSALLRRHKRPVGWWVALVCSLVNVVLLGFTYRVVTQGVIGANIGGGLLVFLVVPLCSALFTGSLIGAFRARAAGRKSPVSTPTI